MGSTDSHLHLFKKDGTIWGVPEYDNVIDESKTQLAKVLKVEGASITYRYDLGDDWRHEVVLEKIIPVSDVATVLWRGTSPRCRLP